MNSVPRGAPRVLSPAALLKLAGLALAPGVAAWFFTPLLLPLNLPPDYPSPPPLGTLNTGLRDLIQRADRDARRHPASAVKIGELGMVYHANLFFDQAEAAYRIASRLAPDDCQWAYAQAALAEETGAGNEQLKFLRNTLRLDPGHVPALLKSADWFLKVDRLDEAAQAYEQAARAPGGAASLHASFGLGRVAARKREWKKVVQIVEPLSRDYRHAAPLYELLHEAYRALGQAWESAAALQSAGIALWKTIPPCEDPFGERLIACSRSSTRLLKHAGLLSRAGLADRAIETGRRAAQTDPQDPDARNFLARTLLTFHGDSPTAVDEALSNVAECLKLRPADPVPLGGFAEDFFKSPKPRTSVERLRALLRDHPDLPGIHIFLGQAADSLEETSVAEAEYLAALKLNPNDSAAYNRLGLIVEKRGNTGEAVTHFRRAIQLNPRTTAARLNLAIAILHRGDYSQGLDQLDELLKINPHDSAAHFVMAFALLSQNRAAEAAAGFRLGLLYRPADVEARFGLASALAALGHRQQALVELRETLRLNPGHPRALQLLQRLGR